MAIDSEKRPSVTRLHARFTQLDAGRRNADGEFAEQYGMLPANDLSRDAPSRVRFRDVLRVIFLGR